MYIKYYIYKIAIINVITVIDLDINEKIWYLSFFIVLVNFSRYTVVIFTLLPFRYVNIHCGCSE